MGEDRKRVVERLSGDVLRMEEDVRRLKDMIGPNKDMSKTVSNMFKDLEVTELSVENIKKTIDRAKEQE